MLDEHLRVARREYCRIPTKVRELISTNALHRLDSAPVSYTVQTADNPEGGTGHMMFFCDKLAFVHAQYKAILQECEARGFTGGEFGNRDAWPYVLPKRWHLGNGKVKEFWNDYQPTPEAIALCKKRMIERIPKKPHYRGELLTYKQAVNLIMRGTLND